jgi:hypothetical protein
MKKREFLAVGGAVPLMLAGCGGDGSGSAPVRLVNASVGYTTGLGFMVNTTQATTADVAYGGASPLETVEAGTVTVALTATNGTGTSTIYSSTRTLSKDSRYDLIAYGFKDELRALLVTERNTAPDSGFAAINVINTSTDIGPVDVFLSTTADLSLATQIAASVGSSTSPASSTYSQVLPGTYFLAVRGANSTTDIRLQSSSTITLADQQILTVILTPGASGTLANAIVITQGTADVAPASFQNVTARVRVVSSINDKTAVIAVAGVLDPIAQPSPTSYAVVPAGTAPAVTVNGAGVTIIKRTDALTGETFVDVPAAGGDYTLMIYLDVNGAPTATLLLDDNTAPLTTTNAKVRLLNLAVNPDVASHSLPLTMYVNATAVATNIPYSHASGYKEVPVPSNQSSVIQVVSGSTVIISRTLPIALDRTYTDIVVGTGSLNDFSQIEDTFSASTDITG